MEAKMKRSVLIFCCVLLAVVVAIAIILVTLYFTVFRGRQPQVDTVAMRTQLNAFNLLLPPVLNLSLAIELRLHNPNYAPFRYGEVVTTVTYHNTVVGQSTAPAGAVPARSTAAVGEPVQVDGDKVILHTLYPADVLVGKLPFGAVMAVAGKAAVLRPFQVGSATEVACNAFVLPFTKESSTHCTFTIHAT